MKFFNAVSFMLIVASYCFLNGSECVLNGEKVKDRKTDRLPNGNKVKILNQFKYLVAIKSQFGIDRLLCGGAILDDFTILSAAHCFYNQVSKQFADKVIIRANTLENHKSLIGGIQRTLDRIYILKSYVKGYDDDDIAIITAMLASSAAKLRLKDLDVRKSLKLTLNSHRLQAVELPSNDIYNETDGMQATIAGYGAHKFIDSDEPYGDRKLRALDVKTVSNKRCGQFKAQIRTSMYICAEPLNPIPGMPQGFCDGDSGGPLIVKNEGNPPQIIGVIDENHKSCNDQQSPGIYIRVSKYVDSFINKVRNKRIDDTIDVHEMAAYQGCFS